MKRTKHWTILVLLALVSGCVKLELPNVVSDTVRAGKDVMGGASGKKETPVMFSNTVVSEAGATPEILEGQCLRELESQAKEKLGKTQLVYKVVSKAIAKKDDKLIATCTVEIM